MSIKKIMAACAASVVAVSAMAVVASAAEATVTIPAKADGSWSDIEYKGEAKFKELFGDDYANLDTVTVKSNDGTVFGYGFQSNSEWTQVEAEPGVTEATITDIKTSGDDCCIKFFISGQYDPIDVTVSWTTKAADAAPAESESKTEESKPAADNTNVNTGVEGVAAVLGVAAVAAGAMIVSKKRK